MGISEKTSAVLVLFQKAELNSHGCQAQILALLTVKSLPSLMEHRRLL